MNKATTAPQAQKDRIEDRVVGRIYDVALDPLSYGDLLDDWDELLAPVRRAADGSAHAALPSTDLGFHFNRLAQILDRTDPAPRSPPEEAALAPFRRVAAFCLTRGGEVTAVNDVARALYGLAPGAGSDPLPAAPEDRSALLATARELIATPAGTTRLMRLHLRDSDEAGRDRPILFRLHHVVPEGGPAFVLVVTSHIRWPSGLCSTLRGSFGLTQSESEVLRCLTQALTPREIAERRGRSVETVRGQIKSLLQKTETRSQGELVRLALSAMDVADPQPAGGAATARDRGRWNGGGATLKALPYRQVLRPDGRRVDYLVMGAPQGRPVVYLGSLINLVRWPARAEAEAARRGLRLIAPIRPGFAGSTPLAHGTPRLQAVADDIAAIANAEGADRFPMVVLGQDANYAAAFDARHPGRLTGLIGCGACLPEGHVRDFDRMGRWHRFIYSSARFTPHLVPFMIRAGLAMARRSGDGAFLRTVLAESPADVALLQDPEVLEAVCAGTVPLVEQPGAAAALAEEYRLSPPRGAARLGDALRADFPVHMLHGVQDLRSPPATLDERAAEFPWITFERLEDAGILVLFRHWRRVLDLADPLTKS